MAFRFFGGFVMVPVAALAVAWGWGSHTTQMFFLAALSIWAWSSFFKDAA